MPLTLSEQLSALTVRTTQEFNKIAGMIGTLPSLATAAKGNLVAAINEVSGRTGTLSTLTTTAKGTLVAAINEVNAKPSGGGSASINDASTTTATTTTYSANKINTLIATAKSELINGAPGTLDTFKELADQMAADETAAAATVTALSNRVRVDINNQGLTGTQQGNARTNIAAVGTAELSGLMVSNSGAFLNATGQRPVLYISAGGTWPARTVPPGYVGPVIWDSQSYPGAVEPGAASLDNDFWDFRKAAA